MTRLIVILVMFVAAVFCALRALYSTSLTQFTDDIARDPFRTKIFLYVYGQRRKDYFICYFFCLITIGVFLYFV